MAKSSMTLGTILLVIIACAGTVYFLLSYQEGVQREILAPEPLPPSKTDVVTAPDTGESQPLTRHPLPPSALSDTATPLPNLEDSDIAMQQALNRLDVTERLRQLLIFKNFINRLVVTIDNLPRRKLPVQHRPTTTPAGKFLAKKAADGSLEIDPRNYQRYKPFVDVFTAMDSHDLTAIYMHFYPLFQETYRDLGYKSAYFNDRVIEAIDDLLATPDVEYPVKLIQPSVFYKYADPHLEALSAGQRLLIRIGPDNADRVKAKLRELRRAFTQSSPPR